MPILFQTPVGEILFGDCTRGSINGRMVGFQTPVGEILFGDKIADIV